MQPPAAVSPLFSMTARLSWWSMHVPVTGVPVNAGQEGVGAMGERLPTSSLVRTWT